MRGYSEGLVRNCTICEQEIQYINDSWHHTAGIDGENNCKVVATEKEERMLERKRVALAKLTPEERLLLGVTEFSGMKPY